MPFFHFIKHKHYATPDASIGEFYKLKFKEDHYYISSKTIIGPVYYLKGICGHWLIENNFHWVKDVIMNEDKSRVKEICLSENLSIIRNMVINIYTRVLQSTFGF